ncbi:unnamed protein product, partial [Cuscuta europaea]
MHGMGSFSPPLFLSLFLIVLILLLSSNLSLCGPLSFHSITPNFSASFTKFIDTSGAFLSSADATFSAAVANVRPEERSFYFVIFHTISHTVVWAANRNFPVSDSAELHLSRRGLALYDDSGRPIWSTPLFTSPNVSSVSSLQLQDSGNLVLLDSSNNSVWESFDYPTDTMVVGQRLLVGRSLVSSLKDGDLSSVGDYEFSVTENDAVFLWRKMVYWKLSMYGGAFRDTNTRVEYAELRRNGIFLVASNGTEIVIQVTLINSPTDFMILKMGSNGALNTMLLNGAGSEVGGFNAPADPCWAPFICQSLGVCNSGMCSCLPGFHSYSTSDGGCVPLNGKLPLPGNSSSCKSSTGSIISTISYLKLGSGMDYFTNEFIHPLELDTNLSTCEDICSRNCSCLGFFHSQSSGSCYMVRDYLGSVKKKVTSNDRLGYIKLTTDPNQENGKRRIPVYAAVLVPLVVVALLAFLVVVWKRGKNSCKMNGMSNSYSSHSCSSELVGYASLPGMPVSLAYKHLTDATDNFGSQIGSGGFGTVYKGSLPDGTEVAVKKMSRLGVQGKREFCSEIATIGKIHHINLVRLKGFCIHRDSRFLVYEYMNRSSLDRALFGRNGGVPLPNVLKWKERVEIAIGTARGLAYLHSGCEPKIIHCDVKPENILLHYHNCLQVKISDFGLSKLMSSEQSSWFTTLRGTRGYLAPEWLTNSSITEKTDVYSYGMVLLELVSGKKNCRGEEEARWDYFPLLVLEMHEEERYLELVDPQLAGEVQTEEVEKLVRVALCCLH